MIPRSIPKFRSGDDIANLTNRFDTIRRIVEPVGQVVGGRGISVNQTPGGTTISNTMFSRSGLPLGVIDIFIAIITGNTAFTEIFKYAWSEAEFGDEDIGVKPGGRTGTTALSMEEVFETTTFQGGVDITASDYTATGFGRRPIGGAGSDNTHKYNVPVVMWNTFTKNIEGFWIQSRIGIHDGPCTAP